MACSAALEALLSASLLWFGTALLGGLNTPRDPSPQAPAHGQDPGLRVLLVNDDKYEHDKLLVQILTDALLVCPDDPLLQQPLYAGDKVSISPNGMDGLIINKQAWAAKRALITPQKRSHSLEAFDEQTRYRRSELYEEIDRKSVFSVQSGRYRGSLEITLTAPDRLAAVNTVPIEAWLEGMLASELSLRWHREAIKAAAIAGRGYAYAQRLNGPRIGKRFDAVPYHVEDRPLHKLSSDPHYFGHHKMWPAITWATTATRGQVLSSQGSPFASFLCPSSGGQLNGINHLLPDARTNDGKAHLQHVMVTKPDPYCETGCQLLELEDRFWHQQHVIDDVSLIYNRLKADFGSGSIIDIQVERTKPQESYCSRKFQNIFR